LKSIYLAITIIISTSVLCSCASKPKKSFAKLIRVHPSNAIFAYVGLKNKPNNALVKKFNKIFEKTVIQSQSTGQGIVGGITSSILLSGVRDKYIALNFDKIFEKYFFGHTNNTIINVVPFEPKKNVADQYVLVIKVDKFEIGHSGATPRMAVTASLIGLKDIDTIIWTEKFRGDDYRFLGQIGAGTKRDRANRMIKSIVDEIVANPNK
jgi:hypothetical protein